MGVMKHVITQNIDNLHQVAGTLGISEFHGNRYKLALRHLQHPLATGRVRPACARPPECPRCGGLIKSDTVMFGEPIPPDAISRSFDEARLADCCLVIGTSAVVYPAAEVPMIVRRNGGHLIEINPLESAISRYCDVALRAPAGEIMPLLVDAVRSTGKQV